MESEIENEVLHIAGPQDRRSFRTLVVLAAQNAFNDKAAQFFLIPLAGWLMSQSAESGMASIEYLLAALIVAPFIFLSPLSGWLSDRYSKTSVIRGGMVLQLVVLLMIVLSIHLKDLRIGVFGFFLLAVQSTLLSPAKKGLVKEMVGSERLGFASGVLEICSVLAICAGQIASGFWFDARLSASGDGWLAAAWPIQLLTMAAIPAVILSFLMKKYPVPKPRPFQMSILWEHFQQLGDLFGERRLRWSGLGVAFFWFFGGFLNLVAIGLGKELTGGAAGFGSEMAWFIAAASGGVILGGMLASLGCRRHIELGLVPIGGMIMVLGCVLMASVDHAGVWMKWWMVLSGAGGALLLVPLNAFIQDVCAPEKRGKVLAGLNLLDCLAGALAVGLQFGLSVMGVGLSAQFLILSGLCAVVVCFSTKLLPQHFVRFTALSLFRIFYRQKVMYAERMPEAGGVLIVPNHVSYVDAFVLSAASPRPIRFLMYDGYFKKKSLLRSFVSLFDTVPISSNRAKEALQIAADAVAEGAVVCIFPEGQLTRSGAMNEIKRGYEMIARKANCPVMPVYMDGMWGSIFSYEGGCLFKKWPRKIPYGVTVAWGEPMSAHEANAPRVRRELQLLSSESYEMRDILRCPQKVIGGALKVIHGDTQRVAGWQREILVSDEQRQRRLLANALQVSETPAFTKGEVVMIDAASRLAPFMAVIVANILKQRVVLVSAETSLTDLLKIVAQNGVHTVVGNEAMWQKFCGVKLAGIEFYHTEGRMDLESGVRCYPLGTLGEVVLSVSTSHPDMETASNQFQAGWKEGSVGRLLPGFHFQEMEGGGLQLDGISMEGVQVWPGEMDQDGFLFSAQD